MAQSLIQLSVDENLRKEVDHLFEDLGPDTSTAIMIFLKQAVKRHGLPFDVVNTVPLNSLDRDNAVAWGEFLREIKKIDGEPIGELVTH